MSSRVKLVLQLSALLSGIGLAGCASHQVTEKSATLTPLTPFQAMQVQVNFATPAHSDYLANQLVKELGKYGISATIRSPDSKATIQPDHNTALLQLTLTGSWTETFISHRRKHRQSLTQMRGRIPRESPRFRSDVLLRDLQTNAIVWQSETVTAGPWYSDFNTNARSLAARLARQLSQQGLIAPASDPVAEPAPS